MPDALLRAQAHLTDRDHVLLGWLYDNGVLSTPQIAYALFPSLDFTQKRLARLVTLGVVDRFRPQRPAGGSYPYHYLLDQLGTDIVTAQRHDEPVRRVQARQRRWHLTHRANLPHLLGTNQFFTDLAGHARMRPGAALERWYSARQCADLGILTTLAGTPVTVARVRPDGHGVWAEHGDRVAFWLEYDTGTEPLPTLVAKLTRYNPQPPDVSWAALSGWPVLFDLPSGVRERNFHHALTGIRSQVPVATTSRGLDSATGGRWSPAGAVWWVHHGAPGPRRRLIDLPHSHVDTAPPTRRWGGSW